MMQIEIYKEFEIEVHVTSVDLNFRTFTCIARCNPKITSPVKSISYERMDFVAAVDQGAMDRAFVEAKKDVDYLISNGTHARI